MAYHTNKTKSFELSFVDQTTEPGKIALKCREMNLCIRGHLEYSHYKIEDRSECPAGCCLNKSFLSKELEKIERINDWDKTSSFKCEI